MKKVLFLICVSTGCYAQKDHFEDLVPKTYTIMEVKTHNHKSYDVTDLQTLETKRYDINKVFNSYNVTETTVFKSVKPKNTSDKKSPYDNISWTSKKKDN